MLRIFYILLLCVGLVISGYLLFRYFTLLANERYRGADVCSEVLGHDCDSALLHPFSNQLGVPMAGWGIIYYGTLLSLVVLGHWLAGAFRREADATAVLIAIIGAATGVAIVGVMAFGYSPFCPLCAAIHAINLLLLPVLWRAAGLSIRKFKRVLGDAIAYLLGRNPGNPATARWRLIGLLTVALVAVVLYQWVVIQVGLQVESGRRFDTRTLINEYESSPRRNIPSSREDVYLGSSDAPVELIVFSDFQCPACKRLADQLPRLLNQFPNELKITFKHFPLGIDCNSALKKDLHPQACEAAILAEVARMHGKFWKFHDAAFASDASETSLSVIAAKLELDLDELNSVRRETLQQKIEADIALGIELGVDGTPAAFLDGRRLYDLRSQTIVLLIEHQLKRMDR